MIKYEVFRKRGKVIWLEVHGSWGQLVEETRKQDCWEANTIRVPLEGLRNALARITIQHEVAP